MANKNDAGGFSLLETNSEKLRQDERLPEKKPLRTEKAPVNRKKIYFVLVIAVSIVLAAFISIRMIMTVNEQLVYELRINETDITNAEDGVYAGSYESSHLSADVSVSILSGRIIAIELDSSSGIDSARADAVFDSVIYYQMLNTPDDDIGATPTDIVLLKAVEKALTGAVTGE